MIIDREYNSVNLYVGSLDKTIIKWDINTAIPKPFYFTYPINTFIIFELNNEKFLSTGITDIKIPKTEFIEEDTLDTENFISDSNSLILEPESKDPDTWINNNCYSNASIISGESLSQSNYSDVFTIKLLNKTGKFEKGECILKSEFKENMKSDIGEIPINLMAIYTKPYNPLKDEDYITGVTSKPTGRFIIKLPSTIPIYITLGSAIRIFKEKNNIWYALPLFGGKRKRIGNIAGSFGSSRNHGQIPGFIIYKLFTKDEIKKNIKVKETTSDYPLSLYVYNNLETLFDILGANLKSDEEVIINFSDRIILNLIQE